MICPFNGWPCTIAGPDPLRFLAIFNNDAPDCFVATRLGFYVWLDAKLFQSSLALFSFGRSFLIGLGGSLLVRSNIPAGIC